MLYNPIKPIGNNYNNVQMALMAMERVFRNLGRVPSIRSNPEAQELTTVGDCIEYRDVCFGYKPGHPVLKHVNLKIAVGQTVAFCRQFRRR